MRYVKNFWLNKMFQANLGRKELIDNKIPNYLLAGIFALYPLYLFEEVYSGISQKVLLFSTMVLVTGLAHMCLAAKRAVKIYRPSNIIDYFFLFYFLINYVLCIFYEANEKSNLEQKLLALSIIIAYFLISNSSRYNRKYLDLFLYASAFVFIGLWIHCLINQQFVEPIGMLISNKQTGASYLLLLFTISSIFYSTESRQKKSWFYIIMNGLSVFYLFIVHDIVGMLFAPTILLCIPLIFKPTVELVKRVAQLFFLYFFLLSNMGLLVNSKGLIKKELTYNIVEGVQLNLIMVVAIVFFFFMWEKIPEGTESKILKLPKVRRYLRKVFIGGGAAAFVLLFVGNGNKLEMVKSNACGAIPGQILLEFQKYYTSYNGTFYDAMELYGIIGFFAVIFFALLILKVVHRTCFVKNKELFLILYVFVAQSLFYSQQSVTTPIYIVLLAMAIHGGQNCREPERG